MMKRVLKLLGLSVLLLLGLTSCRGCEDFGNEFRYTNPRKLDSTFTVYQNNTKFEHLKCIYWATEDDDTIFVDSNGNHYFVNGSSIIVEE